MPASFPICTSCRWRCWRRFAPQHQWRPEPPSRSTRSLPSGWLRRFEQLRDRSDALLAARGKRPSVFLANLGSHADFTARATFAKSLFEAGGIEALDGDGGADPAAIAAAFKASGAPLACLCSTDKVYASLAAQVAEALHAAGAQKHCSKQ